jgi:hypothetical protein
VDATDQEQDHGQDHHIADGIGQADELGGEAIRAGAIHRAEDGAPADDQQGAGDDRAVKHAGQAGDGSTVGGGKEQDAGDREGHGTQVAGVGQRRVGNLLPEANLVEGPNGLAGGPQKGRDADQDPGNPDSPLVPPGGQAADACGQEGDGGFANVIDAFGEADAAPAERDPGAEGHREERCREQRQGEIPAGALSR